MLLTGSNQLCHASLPSGCRIAVDNVFLSCGVYGLKHSREQCLRICFLSFFRQIRNFTNHGFHVRFERKTTLATYFVLLGPFDGGLNKWHKAGKSYASDSLRSRKDRKKKKENPCILSLTEFQLSAYICAYVWDFRVRRFSYQCRPNGDRRHKAPRVPGL